MLFLLNRKLELKIERLNNELREEKMNNQAILNFQANQGMIFCLYFDRHTNAFYSSTEKKNDE